MHYFRRQRERRRNLGNEKAAALPEANTGISELTNIISNKKIKRMRQSC
jgi:hypothetical protein